MSHAYANLLLLSTDFWHLELWERRVLASAAILIIAFATLAVLREAK